MCAGASGDGLREVHPGEAGARLQEGVHRQVQPDEGGDVATAAGALPPLRSEAQQTGQSDRASKLQVGKLVSRGVQIATHIGSFKVSMQ